MGVELVDGLGFVDDGLDLLVFFHEVAVELLQVYLDAVLFNIFDLSFFELGIVGCVGSQLELLCENKFQGLQVQGFPRLIQINNEIISICKIQIIVVLVVHQQNHLPALR